MTGSGSSLRPTRHMVLAVMSVTAVLAGCAADAVPSASPEPTPAERPAVPDGWKALTSDEGDIRLVVPPEAAVLLTAGSILVQAPPRDPTAARDPNALFEVWVTGPDALDQPAAGQATVRWLEQSGWMPQEGDGFIRGPTTEREVLLPAGPALEVTTSVQPGTPEEGQAVLYVVATDRGLAILRFVGTPEVLEERAVDIQLISRLVEFGD